MTGVALSQTVALLVSWLVALIFAAALRHKVQSWARFKASFAAYRLVPERLVTPVAVVLAGLEGWVVLGCLAGLPAALLTGGGLFFVYGVAMAINLFRGRRFIDCGCGDEPTPLGAGLLVRNLVLVGLATAAAGGVPDMRSAGLEVLVALLGAGVAYGIYAAIDQLLANRGLHRRLWLGVS